MAWMAVLGAAGLMADAGLAWHVESFMRSSIRVEGRVVGLTDIPDTENGGTTYAPKFSFHAGDGTLYTVQSKTGNNPPAFWEGETVEVLYPADAPAKAKINKPMQLWLSVIVIGAGSLFFVLLGLVGPSLERRYGVPESD